jgi:hypothetical protein
MISKQQICSEKRRPIKKRKGIMLGQIITIIAITLTLSTTSLAQSGNELRQSWKDIAELISASGRDDAAVRLLESVDRISDEELERTYSQESLNDMINVLNDILKAVDASKTLRDLELTETASVTSTSEGFPTNLDYPDSNYCPLSPGRSNGLALQIAVDAVTAGRIALEVAKGVWSGLSRGCDEVVVLPVVGGGNLSLACIPADIVLFIAEGLVGAAEGVVEHFEACDNGVDSAEIEGTWNGVVHINSVLEAHEDQLMTHDEDIKRELFLIHDKLDTQGEMLEIVLDNQQKIMNLLRTPQGRRPGWNERRDRN